MTAAEVQRRELYEKSVLQAYRDTDLKMRRVAREIDNRKYEIERLQHEIEKLESELRLLVRLPRESFGEWSKPV